MCRTKISFRLFRDMTCVRNHLHLCSGIKSNANKYSVGTLKVGCRPGHCSVNTKETRRGEDMRHDDVFQLNE